MSGWKGEKRRIRSWIGDLLYQEETVITFTVKDITIQDMNKAGRVTSLLSPVEYKDLVSAAGDIRVYWILLFFFLQRSNPRSLLELHLTSKAVRGTNAKESRVKVSLHSFAYNLFTDFDFAVDLGAFFKAPPGVSARYTFTGILIYYNILQTFETVVPTERTKLSVRVTDGSVKAHASTHPGALVFYIGDLTVDTDLVGDAVSSLLHVLVPELSILLLDDLESRTDGPASNKMPASVNQGVAYWKVSPHISHRLG